MRKVGRTVVPWWWRNPRVHLVGQSCALLILVAAGFGFWYENRPIPAKQAIDTTVTAIESRYKAASTGNRADWEVLHAQLTDQARDVIEKLPPTQMAPLPITYRPLSERLIQSSSGSAVVETDGAIDVRLPGYAEHTTLVRELVVLRRDGPSLKVAAWNFIGSPPAELQLSVLSG